MRDRARSFFTAGAIAGLAYCFAVFPGCARIQEPREWGPCAGVGALLGADAGAASGIVIADNSKGKHPSSDDARTFSGLGGAVIGAALGGLAGHYM